MADDWRTMPIRSRHSRPRLLRVDAEDRDAAAVALAVALEHLDRRRLAGAVRPEEAEDLALLDLEADRRERPRPGRRTCAGRVTLMASRHASRPRSITTRPAVGNGGSGPPVSSARDPAAVGLVPDGDDRLAALRDCVAHGVGRRARREPLVGLGGRPERAGDLLAGLAGAEQRARDDGRHRPRPRRRAGRRARAPAGGRSRGQRAQLVRLARSGLGVADEVEPHGPRIDPAQAGRPLGVSKLVP